MDVCVPKEIASQIKKIFPKETVYQIGSVPLTQQDEYIRRIVDQLSDEVDLPQDQRILFYQGLRDEVVAEKRKALKNNVAPPKPSKKKSVEEMSTLEFINSPSRVYQEYKKLPASDREAYVENLFSMMPEEAIPAVKKFLETKRTDEAITKSVRTEITKGFRQLEAEQRFEESLINKLSTIRDAQGRPKQDQSPLKRIKQTVKELASLEPEEAKARLDDIVSEVSEGNRPVIRQRIEDAVFYERVFAMEKEAENFGTKVGKEIANQIQKLEKRLTSISDKYLSPIDKKAAKKEATDVLDILNNKSKLIQDVRKMNPEDRMSYLDSLIKTDYTEEVGQQIKDAILLEIQAKERKSLQAKANQILATREPVTQKNIFQKIDNIQSFEDLNDPMLQRQIAEKKLGIPLEGDQIQKLYDAGNELKKHVVNDRFDPVLEPDGNRPSKKYMEALQKYGEAYSEVVGSSNKQKLISASKALMLSRLSTQVINIVGNTVLAPFETISRSFRTGVTGIARSEVSKSAYKTDNISKLGFSLPPIGKTKEFIEQASIDAFNYLKYDYDNARNTHQLNSMKTLGEEIIVPTSKVGKAVFASFKSLAVADQFFASYAKRDASYRQARQLVDPALKGEARKESVERLYREIMNAGSDAPEDIVLANNFAILEADRATLQNKTAISQISGNVRNALNTVDFLPAGEYVAAFVHTGSVYISTGLDYSGITTIPKASAAFIKKAIDNKGLNRQMWEEFIEDEGVVNSLSRVWSIPAVAAVASLVPMQYYRGAYPGSQRDRNLYEEANQTTNAVKIGGVWISLDYAGPAGATFAAMMSVRQASPQNLIQGIGAYMIGGGRQAMESPMFEGLSSTLRDIEYAFQERDNAEAGVDDAMTYLMSQLDETITRFIPGYVQLATSSFDEYERETRDQLFGRIRAAFPVSRWSLDQKITTFGEPVKNERLLEFVAGHRIQGGTDDWVTLEYERLRLQGGQNVFPTKKIENTTFNFPEEDKQELMQLYGRTLYDQVKETMTSDEYTQSLSDEDRGALLTDLEGDVWRDFKKNVLEERYGKPE